MASRPAKKEMSEELEPPAWLTVNFVPEEGEKRRHVLPGGRGIAGWLAAVIPPRKAVSVGIPDWLHELDKSEERLSQGTA